MVNLDHASSNRITSRSHYASNRYKDIYCVLLQAINDYPTSAEANTNAHPPRLISYNPNTKLPPGLATIIPSIPQTPKPNPSPADVNPPTAKLPKQSINQT
jgi:hypothetical protein